MKQHVNWHEGGDGVVVEHTGVDLRMWVGKQWPDGNWTGTEDQFVTLRKENPFIVFEPIRPRH